MSTTKNETTINDLINDLQFIARYPENSNTSYICRLAAEKLAELSGKENFTELNSQIETLIKQRDAAIADIPGTCMMCKYYDDLPDCSHKLYAPCDPNCLGWTWRGLK